MLWVCVWVIEELRAESIGTGGLLRRALGVLSSEAALNESRLVKFLALFKQKWGSDMFCKSVNPSKKIS